MYDVLQTLQRTVRGLFSGASSLDGLAFPWFFSPLIAQALAGGYFAYPPFPQRTESTAYLWL
ncbi:hypothetical protein PISMIDRAFT_674546, partial [Pisolithus microcarpus 441]